MALYSSFRNRSQTSASAARQGRHAQRAVPAFLIVHAGLRHPAHARQPRASRVAIRKDRAEGRNLMLCRARVGGKYGGTDCRNHRQISHHPNPYRGSDSGAHGFAGFWSRDVSQTPDSPRSPSPPHGTSARWFKGPFMRPCALTYKSEFGPSEACTKRKRARAEANVQVTDRSWVLTGGLRLARLRLAGSARLQFLPDHLACHRHGKRIEKRDFPWI